MDKYQKFIFNENYYSFYCYIDGTKNYCNAINLDDENITITQDEDITKKDYYLACTGLFEYLDKNQWKMSEYDNINRRYMINFDFDCPITQIRLVEKNNLVEPLIININVILADKNAYFAKKKEEELQFLIKNASIEHSIGKDLINIYFQPCQDNYAKTEIDFYIADGIYKSGGGYPIASRVLVDGKNKRLIARYPIETGIFFKSITGLAPGVYAYSIKQYSQEETLLFETEPQYIQIQDIYSSPSTRKPVVRIP